jgi:hypothetical protein
MDEGTASMCKKQVSDHHGVMATEQTCQRKAAAEVQFLQIDASFNSIDAWNAQQKSAIITG